MVKKFDKPADKPADPSNDEPTGTPGGLFDSALAGAVRESAQQIWLAGMGAFSKAQAEGGKVFEALVKEGTTLQRKTQAAAEERFGDVGSRMSAMADDMSAKAGRHWDKLESIFEQRVSKALNKLGVPSAKDVDTLISRIDALNAKVDRLAKTKAHSAAKSPKPGAPRAAARRSGTE
jgi:poly(hydroxyalkanoate) granule-associated protein